MSTRSPAICGAVVPGRADAVARFGRSRVGRSASRGSRRRGDGSTVRVPDRGVAATGLRGRAQKTELTRQQHAPTGAWDGELQFLGVLAPIGGFITHNLFPVRGGKRWLGKRFDRRGDVGTNRFGSPDGDVLGRDFQFTISPSRYDGKDALVLNYAAAPTPDLLWGTALRMRDELREIAPGLFLGLGSMRASGGMHNSAPFVLRRSADASGADAAVDGEVPGDDIAAEAVESGGV